MTARISLLCPTRNRPDNVWRLLTSCGLAGPVEVVLYVDDDDRSMDRFVAPQRVKVLRGPRVLLSEAWNRCYEQATADILMHCGDDIVFRTPGWDQLVVDAFDAVPDRIALVHGDDLVHGQKLATHGFLHRRWVETVGYFCPPHFSSDWNDTWLTEVADMLGRRIYLPDLVTEHMHPAVGKAAWDLTHRERLARGERDRVAEMYASKAAEREADVAKLRAVMEA